MEFAVKKFFIYRAKGDGTYRTPQPWKKKHALLQKWNLRIKVWDLDKKEVPNQASNPLLSCTTYTGGLKTLTFGLFWVNSVLGWCRSENLRHLEHAIKERDSIGRGMVLVRDHMRTALKVEHVTTPEKRLLVWMAFWQKGFNIGQSEVPNQCLRAYTTNWVFNCHPSFWSTLCSYFFFSCYFSVHMKQMLCDFWFKSWNVFFHFSFGRGSNRDPHRDDEYNYSPHQ